MAACHVILLGGYGFFGRRLADRLARIPGLHITIAGRDGAQACALAAKLAPPAAHAVLDASAPDLADRLRALGATAVVNASGPFQGQDHRIPLACIAAGAHCIDIADGTDYVAGIAALDAQARAAGVAIVSGASSVPGLSSAAADQLAAGLAQVEHIDIGITPGNRTDRGLSTLQSVLSYCGHPIASGGSPTPVHGWSGGWVHRFPAPVGARRLSPCDVPDLAVLPGRYAGQPVVRFGAGLELAVLQRGMNVLAWLARRGWVRNWQPHAALLKRLSDPLRLFGSDAGGMHVTLRGRDAQGRTQVRGWHLTATHGEGPYVPTLAATALVRRLASGRALPAGAGPCVGLLTPQEILAEAEGLHITAAVEEAQRPLFSAVMGDRYGGLHEDLRAFHDLRGCVTLHGEVRTEPAERWLGRWLGMTLGTPRTATAGPMRFELHDEPGAQRWTRHFPHRAMTSRMRIAGGRIVETLGPSRLTFALEERAGRLHMQLERMHFLGVPCPAWLMPRVVAVEQGGAGRLHFDVSASVPGLGRVVGYKGHLDVSPDALHRAAA